jgi:2-iminobutanoate/2-iminopropanoate deaminase
MPRHTITATNAPAPVGPYAHATHSAPGKALIYLSGQTPIDPGSGLLVDGDVTTQTTRALTNLADVLAAVSLTLDDVIKVNVYLTDMADFAAMNAAYADAFAPPYPARTTVAVAGLPLGANVEIEAVAQTR